MSRYYNEIMIFIVTVLLFSLFNWLLPVSDPVESNYALTAKEMLQSGDYLNMKIYGQYWYDKPIFIYWTLILSYNIFGINAFAARLPMVIASGLSLAFIYYFAGRLYTRRIAWLSTGILATCLAFWVIGKAIVTDSILFLFDCGGLGWFYLALREKQARYYAAAYSAFALAVLTKGPVGIVLPAVIILVYCIWVNEAKWWKSLWLKRGLAIFALVALPWYLYMVFIHGNAFIQEFLGLHNVTRALVAEHPKDNVVYYYVVLVPFYFMPWSVVFLQSLYAQWQQRARDQATLFYLCWLGITLLFYSSIATKYPTYPFIVVFPAVLMMAIYIDRQLTTAINANWCWSITIPVAGLLLLLILGAGRLAPASSFGSYVFLSISLVMFVYLQTQNNALQIIKTTIGGMLLLMVVLSATILPNWLQTRSLNITAVVPVNRNIFIGIYGDYRASAVFNSNIVLTALRDHGPEPTDIWARKRTMPAIDWKTFLQQTKEQEVYLLIQKEKYRDFLNKNLTADYTFIKQQQGYLLFQKIKLGVLPDEP